MVNLGAEHENLDHKAYLIIKNMIIDRKLLPGDKIPQEKLARELGISRTPLVSAIKYLEHEKLVEAKPRRGYFVRLFSKQEMISIFELREVLEGLAAINRDAQQGLLQPVGVEVSAGATGTARAQAPAAVKVRGVTGNLPEFPVFREYLACAFPEAHVADRRRGRDLAGPGQGFGGAAAEQGRQGGAGTE